ncbi:MAG TPA: N-acetylglucosamine-6-phosphate deacetylase [Chloroflexota bacterium]|nr:N-acetylglucosamine-6-phosphate deacetylase [Chloroflexota bacterium]
MSTAFVIRAARVLTPLEVIINGAVVVQGSRILHVGPDSSTARPDGAELIDLGSATLVPGFVDVHIHGSGGDTAMSGASAVQRISRFLARHGVTCWLPTLTWGATFEESLDIVRAAALGCELAGDGAEAAGLHLEGPFLSPKRPGAIRPESFRIPSLVDLDALLDAGRGFVRLMTIAPELPGGRELVERLVSRGVTASIGHSDATVEEARGAIASGVTHATHAFNAMRGLHHRDPGVVGAIMVSDQVTAELIADGVHVETTAMKVLIWAKGSDRVAVITDAIAAAGLGDGDFTFDGRPISVRDGKAFLADGTIAGSVSRLDDNVRGLVRDCSVPLSRAIAMATRVPARSVGLEKRKGYLAGGYDADIVALDSDLNVRFTMARGRIVFRDDESPVSRR